MADPVTLATIGAVGGAMLNRDDPIKGALIGGTLGYGGGTVLGPAMGASGSAAPIVNATYGAGATPIANLTAQSAGSAAINSAIPSAFGNAVNAAAGPAANTVPLGSFGNVGMTTQGFGNTMGTSLSPTSVAGLAQTTPPVNLANSAALGGPSALGGSRGEQAMIANSLLRRQDQQQVRAPQPMPIQRGQAMKYPTLDELYKMQMAQAAPRFSLL
jgi:hypothetical protein